MSPPPTTTTQVLLFRILIIISRTVNKQKLETASASHCGYYLFVLPDHVNSEESNLGRSVSVATGLNNIVKRPRVRTIFPHAAGNNSTLLSFDEGDVINLLIPDERDGWMYGELEKTGR